MLKGDMIQVYKQTKGKYDEDVSNLLCKQQDIVQDEADTTGATAKSYTKGSIA